MAGMPVQISNTDLAVGFRTHLYQQEQREPCAGRVDGLKEKLLAVTNRTSLNLSAAERMRLEEPLVDRHKLKELLVAKRPLTADESGRLAAAQTEEAKARELDAIIEARKTPEGEFIRARNEAVDIVKLQSVLQARKEQLVEEAKQELAQIDELFVKCAELEAARKGFLWDFAGAAAGRFADASVAARDWLSWALWTSIAYEGEGASGILLARFQRNKVLAAWDGFADAGLRGLVARKKYALSLEAIARYRVQNAAPGEDRWFYRLAVAADYLVFGESWLSVGFGRDFSTSEAGSLFTLANLKWGFGKPTVKPN
jgi:hypothetical protein